MSINASMQLCCTPCLSTPVQSPNSDSNMRARRCYLILNSCRWSSSPSSSSSSKIFYKLLNFSPFFDDRTTIKLCGFLFFDFHQFSRQRNCTLLDSKPPRARRPSRIILWYLCVNTLECAQFVVGALVSREQTQLGNWHFSCVGRFFPSLCVALFCISSASDSLLQRTADKRARPRECGCEI